MKQKKQSSTEYNRRDFLKGSSAATLMTLLGGVELMAPPTAKAVDAEKLHGPPVNSAVIGLGVRGRDIVSTLARLGEAKVAAVCDKHPAFLRRGASAAPGATSVSDYGQVLD